MSNELQKALDRIAAMDLPWPKRLEATAHTIEAKLASVERERDELREALAKITSKWPAAFECLAPSFRHMTSGDQVATVNSFDQVIIAGTRALANLNKTDGE